MLNPMNLYQIPMILDQWPSSPGHAQTRDLGRLGSEILGWETSLGRAMPSLTALPSLRPPRLPSLGWARFTQVTKKEGGFSFRKASKASKTPSYTPRCSPHSSTKLLCGGSGAAISDGCAFAARSWMRQRRQRGRQSEVIPELTTRRSNTTSL